jgi:hypothetical protein
MTSIFKLFLRSKIYEKGIFKLIADYIGISIDDMEISNKLAINGKVPAYDYFFDELPITSIESHVNALLDASVYDCVGEILHSFSEYCISTNKTEQYFDTVIIFLMTHQDFNEYRHRGEWWDDDWQQRYYELSTTTPFIIKPKHILYTMFINKSILPNLKKIVKRFNMNKQYVYHAILEHPVALQHICVKTLEFLLDLK